MSHSRFLALTYLQVIGNEALIFFRILAQKVVKFYKETGEKIASSPSTSGPARSNEHPNTKGAGY